MYELPIFPLNTVLFPGMPLRLHIFEERYRLMMQRVLQTNQTFGVNLIRKGLEAEGPLPEPYQIGCTARVVRVENLDDGRLNITVVGDERFHVLRLGTANPYLTAFAESMPLVAHQTLDVVRGTHLLRERLMRYMALLSNPDQEGSQVDMELDFDLASLQLPEDPMMLIYLSAALLQVPASEKQPLLEAETAALLLERVQRLYRRELALLPPLLEVSDEQARLAAFVN